MPKTKFSNNNYGQKYTNKKKIHWKNLKSLKLKKYLLLFEPYAPFFSLNVFINTLSVPGSGERHSLPFRRARGAYQRKGWYQVQITPFKPYFKRPPFKRLQEPPSTPNRRPRCNNYGKQVTLLGILLVTNMYKATANHSYKKVFYKPY